MGHDSDSQWKQTPNEVYTLKSLFEETEQHGESVVYDSEMEAPEQMRAILQMHSGNR